MPVEGLFALGFIVLVFWEPAPNWVSTYTTYNSYYVNLGSWGGHLPGWLSPNGSSQAVPLLWTTSMYLYGLFGGAVAGARIMRRAAARWPRVGTVGLVGWTFAGFVGISAVFQLLALLAGVMAHPGAIAGLSLFAGRRYQLPLYDVISWGALLTAFACLLYYRNRNGHSLPESGIDEVPVGARLKTMLRLLAVIGVLQTTMVGLYVVPRAVATFYSETWPRDVVSRPYLTDSVCGAATDRACPGGDVPFAKADRSPFVDRQGRLVEPGGPASTSGANR